MAQHELWHNTTTLLLSCPTGTPWLQDLACLGLMNSAQRTSTVHNRQKVTPSNGTEHKSHSDTTVGQEQLTSNSLLMCHVLEQGTQHCRILMISSSECHSLSKKKKDIPAFLITQKERQRDRQGGKTEEFIPEERRKNASIRNLRELHLCNMPDREFQANSHMNTHWIWEKSETCNVDMRDNGGDKGLSKQNEKHTWCNVTGWEMQRCELRDLEETVIIVNTLHNGEGRINYTYENRLRELSDSIWHNNIRITGVPEEEREEGGRKFAEWRNNWKHP